MERQFPEAPIIGVGAVVIEEDRVLLVRRGQEPLQGHWSLPGGALELGERLQEGVAREVQEETGLHVEPLEVIEVFDHIAREEDSPRVRFHYVLIDYLCRPAGGELCCASDATEVHWATRSELREGSEFAVLPFTLAVIEKGFARFAELTGAAEASS